MGLLKCFILIIYLSGLAINIARCIIKDKKYEALEVINKSPRELVEMRGFRSEIHYARTKDGYYIHLIRVVHPLIKQRPLKRPVLFNHGLAESSTIYLVNAHGVKPEPVEDICAPLDLSDGGSNSTKFLNGPMMLSNHGYDVWLMSMRGTDWSLRHDKYDWRSPQFWDYSLDDFGLIDIPTCVDYIRRKTGSEKVAYIGHSQATFSVFGLLSMKPQYADVIEPVFALAPVAYFDNITSITRLLFTGVLNGADANTSGPFPKVAKKFRADLTKMCTNPLFDPLCDLIYELIGGRGKELPRGYFSHMPFFTSLKVLRHFGQLIKNKRYMMYDYGKETNLRLYGSEESPSYPVERIQSKSLCLFSTESDALSPPKDVARFKARLRVPLYHDALIKGDFNHFDLIADKGARELVHKPILLILDTFERNDGLCAEQQEEFKSDENLIL